MEYNIKIYQSKENTLFWLIKKAVTIYVIVPTFFCLEQKEKNLW